MARDPYKVFKTDTHESYGMIGVSRTHGTETSLFGSSVKHHTTIRLTIHTCKLSRDHQKNHYFSDKLLAEVEMSASQYADMISSPNIGDGVPCTVRYISGDEKRRERPPDVNFKKQAGKDLKEEMQHLGDNLKELKKKAKDILGKKGNVKVGEKKELLRAIEVVEMELTKNLPYVHDCFNEAIERTMTEAKAEMEATVQGIKEQLGNKALAEEIKTPLLEE
jgi:hypothetical protein